MSSRSGKRKSKITRNKRKAAVYRNINKPDEYREKAPVGKAVAVVIFLIVIVILSAP